MPTQSSPTREYLSHFRLVSDPFSLTPDPRFLFLSETHAEALAALDLGLMERRGLIVVVGEVGTGKTTLAHHLLATCGSGVHLAYLTNTSLDFTEILAAVLAEFGVKPAGSTKWDLIVALTEFVTAADRRDETVAIIVDEAQNLSPVVLEEFRLLLNLETTQRKLLQIVLLGQPELHERLQHYQLRHLADRIAVRCFINPLSRSDCESYIDHRLLCAAGVSETITKSARQLIVKEAKGIPRAINILCHNALLFAFGRGGDQVERVDAKASVKEKRGEGLVLSRVKMRLSPAFYVPLGILLGALAVLAPALIWGGSEMRGGGIFDTPTPEGSRPGVEYRATEPRFLVPREGVPLPAEETPEVRVVATRPPVQSASSSGGSIGEDRAPRALGEQSEASLATDPRPLGSRLGQGREGQVIVRIEQATTVEDLVVAMYGTSSEELMGLVRSANPILVDRESLQPGLIVSFPQPGLRSATLGLP